ncbi:hypothetical protein [Cohnella sp.]|uniref:hypothetical protein n=1 Tax=Cohnella sp. TaxID=1883426 RepID=UPI0035636483
MKSKAAAPVLATAGSESLPSVNTSSHSQVSLLAPRKLPAQVMWTKLSTPPVRNVDKLQKVLISQDIWFVENGMSFSQDLCVNCG